MEKLFVLAVAVGFTFLNSLHVITQWFANPPDRVFTGIAHYVADYFLYVDVMAQGAAGHLLTAAHFTNEPMTRTWIYWFNALLGWLGQLVGLSPFATYNVALVFFVFLLCLLWYYLVTLIFPKNRLAQLTSFLFILTASNFFDKGQFWFSPTPAFNRLGGVPHQVFQTILFVLILVIFSRKRNRLNALFLILLSFLAAISNPIQMLLLTIAAGFTQNYFSFALLLIPALVGGFLVNREFALQPILTAAKAWENSQNISVPLAQFFLAVGPLALLVPFGIRSFLKKRDVLRILFFSYGALSMLSFFSPIPKLLGTTPVRWLGPAPYALIGLLAAEAMAVFPKRFVLYSLFFILYSLFTIPSLYSQITSRANPTYELNHVPKPVIDALTFLKNQPDNNRPVVLTDPALAYDVLVPVFTGKISFTGHPIHTLYPQVKENLRRRFFDGEMTAEEAKQFLSDHRIGYAISQKPNLHFATRIFSNEVLSVFSF